MRQWIISPSPSRTHLSLSHLTVTSFLQLSLSPSSLSPHHPLWLREFVHTLLSHTQGVLVHNNGLGLTQARVVMWLLCDQYFPLIGSQGNTLAATTSSPKQLSGMSAMSITSAYSVARKTVLSWSDGNRRHSEKSI